MKLQNTIIAGARANMRTWAKRWREHSLNHDRMNAKIALERALIWRETSHNRALMQYGHA